MVFGILCATLYALTLLTLPLRRMSASPRFRRAAACAHRAFGYALLALSALHLALSFRLFHQRPLALFLLGFALVACAVLACLPRRLFSKNQKRGQLVHKACAISLAILLLAAVGLVFPVVLDARDRSRRLTCEDHLRALGQALPCQRLSSSSLGVRQHVGSGQKE